MNSKENKSKSSSSRKSLESIRENDLAPPRNSRSPLAKCFGVKSYLHEFYDNADVSANSNSNNYHLQRQNLKNKRWRMLWKCSFWTGILLLLTGLGMLLYGYVSSERAVIVGQLENRVDIVDKYAEKFNESLEACKVFGLVAFLAGGLVLACSLLLPSFFCYRQCIYRDRDHSSSFDLCAADSARPPTSSKSSADGCCAAERPGSHLDLKSRIDYKHIQPQSMNRGQISSASVNHCSTLKSEY